MRHIYGRLISHFVYNPLGRYFFQQPLLNILVDAYEIFHD